MLFLDLKKTPLTQIREQETLKRLPFVCFLIISTKVPISIGQCFFREIVFNEFEKPTTAVSFFGLDKIQWLLINSLELSFYQI